MKQYVDIELIEPISGGHNGCIDGIQYFQCKDSYSIHILIPNVIKILESYEIMIKLQEGETPPNKETPPNEEAYASIQIFVLLHGNRV